MRRPSLGIHCAILDTATRLFLDQGFAGVSMMEVSAISGGSKQTLYNHFPSKAGLFAEAMLRAVQARPALPVERLDGEGPLTERLAAFGQAYLDQAVAPEAMALRRVLLADGARAGDGPRLHALYFDAPWQAVARKIQAWTARGELAAEQPWEAALTLRGLLEADILVRRAMGRRTGEARDAAVLAAHQFLRAYAPRQTV